MNPLHPQFVTDPEGKRLSVLLPIAEFEALVDLIEDLEDIEDARKAMDEPTTPWETVKAEMDIE